MPPSLLSANLFIFAKLRGCPEIGTPAAPPMVFQTVLTFQNAVLLELGSLGAAGWLPVPAKTEFRDSL